MDSDSLTAYFLGQAIWRTEHVVSGGWALAVHFLFAITTYVTILLVRLRSKKSMAFAYSSSFGKIQFLLSKFYKIVTIQVQVQSPKSKDLE